MIAHLSDAGNTTDIYLHALFTAVSYNEQFEQMIVFPGHLDTCMTRAASLAVAPQPPDPICDVADVAGIFLPSVRSSWFVRFRPGVRAYTKRYTTPTRSPGATGGIAILLDRRTTAVSNDRHVHAPRYHHSLSLRQEKKRLRSTLNATPIPYQIVTNLSPPPSCSPRHPARAFSTPAM